MLPLIWSFCVIAAICLYLKKRYSFFKDNGIKYCTPRPLLGNFGPPTLRQEHILDTVDKIYKKFPGEKYVGVFEFTTPVIMVKDPDLIRQIGVKDFDHFLDHRVMIDEDVDPLFGRNLFSLKGQKWRDMRATLSPAFTGSKMKNLCNFIGECAKQVADSLTKECEIRKQKEGKSYLDLEMKDVCTRYANDVIASSAFGLKVNSIDEKANKFYEMGKRVSSFSGIQFLKFFGYTSFPALMKILGVQLFNSEVSLFFKNIILDTMQFRTKESILRPDMIHLLMEAKKGNLKHEEKVGQADAGFATVEESAVGTTTHKRQWTDDDLVAQALLFFVAGFDTASTLMNFLAYELALNPEVQSRLQVEIDDSIRANGEKCTYDIVQEMKYLDMVVSECLRLWSPAVMIDRICVLPYKLGSPRDGDGSSLVLQKGQGIWIPVNSIHRDEKYWSEPKKFDPERFSDENKYKIKPFTFLPFGVGPRNCIGSRFALMETKVFLYQLLTKFELLVSPRTPIPVQLAKDTFNLRIKDGCWIRLQSRNVQLSR